MPDSKKAAAAADRLYSQGYNCAKCAYLAVNKAMGTKPEPSILKACSAFGGGIGRSGSVCGALVGAELALSRYTGTTGTDNRKSAAYEKAALLLSKFKKRFGAVDCSKLNGGDFSSDAHRKRCKGFIRFSALAAQKLIGKGKKSE